MEFWQIFLLVNLVAAVFVVWPTIILPKKYKQELRSNARTETNEEVYKDHYSDLEQTLARGEIDESEMEVLRKDLEKTLVLENDMATDQGDKPIVSSFKSRIPVLTLVFALPILTLLLYSHLGAKKDWDIYQLAKQRVVAPAADVPELSQELMTALQKRVKQKPNNTQNWYLLASTAVEEGEFEEGVRAYRKVLDIEPNAPMVKAELAQALFLRAGNTITPEVRRYTNEVLAIAPNIPTALGLAGIDAYRSGEYQEAVTYWRKAVAQLDPNSDAAQALNGGIARAQVALSDTGSNDSSDAQGPTLTLKVSLAKGVNVSSTDTVFIYARAWQGPPMPLAVKKLTVADLPAKVVLDSSMSMMQGMDLGSFPQVEVLARISSSGSATPQPGDWQVKQGPIIVASQVSPLTLKISEQIPAN